ncbi:MAG: FAD binding domain-containing protein, partial [Planctomycetota bacterium]
MRTLPPIRYLAPESLSDAIRALRIHGPRAAALAGGVDLVVRMKERSAGVEVVVDLSALPELRGLRREAESVTIGALTPLSALAREDWLVALFPLLADVIGAVGGRAHRTAATIGGNLLAALRCFALNQSLEWRDANGRCRAEGGAVCHAVPGGRCVATHQTDLAPALAV